MNGNERKKLDSVESILIEVSKEVGYLRGRLEEVHARTAEIPIMVEDQGRVKRFVRAIAALVLILSAIQGVETWAWIRSFF